MVDEDFVTYEQAKKLADLGFDYRCIACYDEEEFDYTGEYNNYNSGYYDLISAPTLAQAQKWLFEKFGFWVEMSLVPEFDLNPYRFIWIISHRKSGHVKYGEGSLRVGIDEVLKLIKTLKGEDE